MTGLRSAGLACAAVIALTGFGVWYASAPNGGYKGPIERITIAHGTTPSATLVLLAYAKGFFAAEGLNVDMRPLPSCTAALETLERGEADLATLGNTPFVLAVIRGGDLRLLSTMNTADQVLSIVADRARGIRLPRDLKGKRLGITPGSGGHFFLAAFLTRHGIAVDEVELVEMRSADLVEAIASGEVDAVSTWQPHGFRAEARLGHRALVFPARGIHKETYNLVGTAGLVAQRPMVIERLLRALRRAETFVADNPEAAMATVAAAVEGETEQIAKIWDSYDFDLRLEQSLLLTLEDEARWAIESRLVESREEPNFLDYLYLNGLDAVKPEAVTVAR